MSATTGSTPSPGSSGGGGSTSNRGSRRPALRRRATSTRPRSPEEPVTRSVTSGLLDADTPRLRAPREVARLDGGQHLVRADRAHAHGIGAGAHLEVVVAEAGTTVEILVEDEVARPARAVERRRRRPAERHHRRADGPAET